MRGVKHRADGRQVAVARADGELRVYDLPAMTEAAPPARLRYARACQCQRSGFLRRWSTIRHQARIGASSRPGLRPARGHLVHELEGPPPGFLGALALDDTGAILAVAHVGAILTYDVASGEVLARLQGHESPVRESWFQPGGGLLATTGLERMTWLWDPIRGRTLAALSGTCQGWRRDGSRLMIASGAEMTTDRLTGRFGRRTIDVRTLGDLPGAAFSTGFGKLSRNDLYGPSRSEYSPDGRLIALALRPDGVRLVRAADGKALARLPIGDCDEAVFLPDGGLLTYNSRGLCRWPIRRVSAGTLRVGPPEPLARGNSAVAPSGLAVAAHGRLVGAGDSPFLSGVLLLDPDRPSRRIFLSPHRWINDLALSPDGRWAATGCWAWPLPSRQVKVWDASTGAAGVAARPRQRPGGLQPRRPLAGRRWRRPVPLLPHRLLGARCRGRARRGGGHDALGVPSWQPGRRHHEPDAEGGAARRGGDRRRARLARAARSRGHQCTELQSRRPPPRRAAGRLPGADLGPRRHPPALDDLGLAAGLPDIFGGGAAAATADEPPAVDRIEVVGADPAGLRLLAIRQVLREAWIGFQSLWDPPAWRTPRSWWSGAAGGERLGHWRLAAADYRAALARRPDSYSANDALARLLAEVPGRGQVEEAVRLARSADLQPPNPEYRQTLGLALYRAGRSAEAATLAESNLRWNGAGVDWLVLAMSRQRLDQAAAARAALAEAVRWRAARPNLRPDQVASFDRLLREAQSLLNEALPDLPADVFAR